MEGWSPRTLVRTGFCRVDSNGRIVSIWNFSELDDHLRSIELSDGVESHLRSDTARDVAELLPLLESASIVPSRLSYCEDGEEGDKRLCSDHEDGSLSNGNLDGRAGGIDSVHDGLSEFVASTGICYDSTCSPRGVVNEESDDFYADLPPLEADLTFGGIVHEELPDLESCSPSSMSVAEFVNTPGVGNEDLHEDSAVWTEELYMKWRNSLEFYAAVILVRAVGLQFGVPDDSVAEFINILAGFFWTEAPKILTL